MDDNRDNMPALGVLLRSEGYIVYLANDGAEALKIAAAFRPYVALLDLLLPDRSGFDRGASAVLPERAFHIAITAHNTADTKERAEITGFRPSSRNLTIRRRWCS